MRTLAGHVRREFGRLACFALARPAIGLAVMRSNARWVAGLGAIPRWMQHT